MQTIKWEPINELERFFGDRPFVSMFPKLALDLALDVYEENGAVVAKMNLPGVSVDDLDISAAEDVLTISGTRKEETEIDKKDYYSKEIRRGSFSRTVSLPAKVDPATAKADYKDGMLTVTMRASKSDAKKPIRVRIEKK